MEETINYICLHCGEPLTGKQEKYCSERCGKRETTKRWKKKKRIQTLKKLYISRHGKKRFEERHGLVFTNKMAKTIVEDILNKKSIFIKKDKNAEQWISEYDNKKYRIIFNSKKEMIITVYSGVKDKKKKPSRKKLVKRYRRKELINNANKD